MDLREINIIKNSYIIGIITYFSFSLLVPNSRVIIILIVTIFTSCLIVIDTSLEHNCILSLEDYKLINKVEGLACSATKYQVRFYQEIVSSVLCLMIYFLNHASQISKRNGFVIMEKNKQLYSYYESMVSSLTHQVVCFSENSILYKNKSFRNRLDYFENTLTKEKKKEIMCKSNDVNLIKNIRKENSHMPIPINNQNTVNNAEKNKNIFTSFYANSHSLEQLKNSAPIIQNIQISEENSLNSPKVMRGISKISPEKPFARKSNPFGTTKVKISNMFKRKSVKNSRHTLKTIESTETEENDWIDDHDYEVTKSFFNSLLLDNEKSKIIITLYSILDEISNDFKNQGHYQDKKGCIIKPCSIFSTLGIFKCELVGPAYVDKPDANFMNIVERLSKKTDKSLINLNEFTKKTFYFEVSFRSFPLKGDSFIIDVVFNDITTIKSAEKYLIESRLKHTLFSKIAHEFKTPLTSIIATIEEVEINFKNKKYSEIGNHLANINNLSNYTIFLINDIIQYSSNDTNKIKIRKEIVDLRAICNFCLNIEKCLLNARSSKNNVKAILEYDDRIDDYEIELDEIRLKQILLNLISNATKFTKSGFIRIKAELITLDKAEFNHESEQCDSDFESQMINRQNGFNKLVKLSVKDTGIGLKPEDVKKIIKNKDDGLIVISTENDYNKLGSGLGLNIVKTLCELLDIKLRVESKYGNGSLFYLLIKPKNNNKLTESIFQKNLSVSNSVLKAIDDSDFDIPSCRKVKSIINSTRSNPSDKSCFTVKSRNKGSKRLNSLVFSPYRSLNNHTPLIRPSLSLAKNGEIEIDSKPKILIVDDNKTIRKSYINLLNNFPKIVNKYDLVELEDGIDIIKAIVDDQHCGNLIKAVFTDENNIYINGSEAIKILRDLQLTSKIKNCLYFSITAFEDEESLSKIIKSGVDLILSKPASKKQIVEVIERYLLV